MREGDDSCCFVNYQIEDASLRYVGHYGIAEFVICFSNFIITIPLCNIVVLGSKLSNIIDCDTEDGISLERALTGKYVRVLMDRSSGRPAAIYHIVKDKCIDLRELKEIGQKQ